MCLRACLRSRTHTCASVCVSVCLCESGMHQPRQQQRLPGPCQQTPWARAPTPSRTCRAAPPPIYIYAHVCTCMSMYVYVITCRPEYAHACTCIYRYAQIRTGRQGKGSGRVEEGLLDIFKTTAAHHQTASALRRVPLQPLEHFNVSCGVVV